MLHTENESIFNVLWIRNSYSLACFGYGQYFDTHNRLYNGKQHSINQHLMINFKCCLFLNIEKHTVAILTHFS